MGSWWKQERGPWVLWAVGVGVGLVVLAPALYLAVEAFQGTSFKQVWELLFRRRMWVLLRNTCLLTLGALCLSLLFAFPLAWLTSRCALWGERLFVLAGVLPLAMPTYMMAYAYLSLGGEQGLLAQLFGWRIGRLGGYWGSLWVLSLCNFPYLFFNLRAALLASDPALEEAARSLGLGRVGAFVRVVLPQLWPGLAAGSLLVGLHILGNFEAVSLMRYKTFSWELFQYRLLDRQYSAWLSLLLLLLTGGVLWAEARFLRRVQLYRTGSGVKRRVERVVLGRWALLAYGFLALLLAAAVLLPVGAILYWFFKGLAAGVLSSEASSLWGASWHSLQSSLPTACLAVLLALPLVYLGVRFPSGASRFFERVSYLGYAIPPIALALGLIFFCLRWVPSLHLSLVLLIGALTLHFLAEAIGPIRSALYQTSPRLEESARALGCSALAAFVRVILPALRRSMAMAGALIFLSCLKELSLNLLIAPAGYSSLAMEVWDKVENVAYGRAAPYALMVLCFSTIFVVCLLFHEKSERG